MDFDDEQEDLMSQLADVDKELELMAAENEMLHNFFQAKSQSDPSLSEDAKKKKVGRKKNVPTTLTPEQKCEIANFTLEELQKEAEQSKKRSEKLVDGLRAIFEETDLRIAELKKEAYEFKRDIVVGAENMRTGKTMAEKILRYMEDKLRQKDQMMEKLRLKNATLKAQKAKIEHQLNQKEEMGDILHYIDFHQLQIENKQYVVKIEDLNDELLKLKVTTGKTVKALSKAKADLDGQITDSHALERDIKTRVEQLSKVRDDNIMTSTEIQQEKRIRKRLSQEETDTSGIPQVLDYVAQKAEMYELQDAVRNWKKKVEIMEAAARKAEKLMRQQPQSRSHNRQRTRPHVVIG